MAAELKAHHPDAEITLLPSSGGRFEVLKDGMPVFQKSKLNRHADPGEVLRLLAEAS